MDYQLLAALQVGSIYEYFNTEPRVSIEGNVLILTSPSVEKIATVQNSIESIASLSSVEKISVFHITPEAPIQQLDEIIAQLHKPDHIIGIGGGSVIDASKVLSLAWNGVTVSDLFYKLKEFPSKKIKVTVVPTTAGTGAELSHGAIVYDKSASKKGGIRGPILQPDSVIIDTEIYKFAPSKLIAETGFDCLTHAVETYCSKMSNGVVRYQAVKAIETVFKNLKQAAEGNENAIERMALAASFMGLNLAYGRTCLPHRIQYVIGPFTNTSHAQGLIMLYRGWLPLISKKDVFMDLAFDLQKSIPHLINEIQKLKKDFGIDYKLGDFGVRPNDVDILAEKVSGAVELDPCYQNLQTIKQIIKNSI